MEVLASLQDVRLATSGELDARLTVDPRWQTEALSNIIKNCIEHSRQGAVVKLRVVNAPLSVQISITDTGEGITTQELRHILNVFIRRATQDQRALGLA